MTRPYNSTRDNRAEFTIEQMADRFIKSRQQDKSESTIYNNKGHLSDFITWCHEHDIQTIGEFDTPEGPFHIEDYLNHVGDLLGPS